MHPKDIVMHFQKIVIVYYAKTYCFIEFEFEDIC